MVTETQNNPQPENKSAKFKKAVKKTFTLIVILAILSGSGWYLYKNPQLLNIKTDSAKTDKIAALEAKIQSLQNQIAALQNDASLSVSRQELNAFKNDSANTLAELNKKIDNVADINTEIIDAKASNATVLGVVSRLDNLEKKVNSFGQVSTRGALVLTAAMLVKDSADSGRQFIYEAEVLRNLAQGTNMQAPAEEISALATKGIFSKQALINEFNKLYILSETKEVEEEVQKEPENEKNQDWKAKINEKLSKLVVIEYHDDNENAKESMQDEVYRLVNEGELYKAAVLMEGNAKYQSPEFKKWQENVKAQESFNDALRQIEALTLAVMKAESLTSAE